MTNRRKFIRNSALLSAGLMGSSFNWQSSPTLDSIGVQLFSLPRLLESDLDQGLALLSNMGYKEVQLFGPFAFSAQSAKDRWQTITPMLGFSGSGLFGKSVKDFKALLNTNNLKATAAHTDLDTLEHAMGPLAEAANELGIKYVGIPAISPELRVTLDDYRKMAERFNKIGANAVKNGLRFAYHNHGYGLQERDGHIPMELILSETDPDLVDFELDIFWAIAGGADPVSYLESYPGRFKLMHLKDMKTLTRFSGNGDSPAEWIELFPQMTTLGAGIMDFSAIINAAVKSGVEHYYVEQDMVTNPETALKASIEYLMQI